MFTDTNNTYISVVYEARRPLAKGSSYHLRCGIIRVIVTCVAILLSAFSNGYCSYIYSSCFATRALKPFVKCHIAGARDFARLGCVRYFCSSLKVKIYVYETISCRKVEAIYR